MNIFIDWGTTNFRAFLAEQDGSIKEQRQKAGQGAINMHGSNKASYSQFLQTKIPDWLSGYPNSKIILCGAIGSREGWSQTGYVPAPAGLQDFSTSLHLIPPDLAGDLSSRKISIVPGISIHDEAGRHDTMRSEEIKSLGAAALLSEENAVLCIPGTHCKWVQIEESKITQFQSAMTGELFGLLGERGCLATLFNAGAKPNPAIAADMESFDRGLALARQGRDLLTDLFQVRSPVITATAPANYNAQACLSGVLIGHEIRAGRAMTPEVKEVILLADEGLRQGFYRHALQQEGFHVKAIVPSDVAVCKGLALICRSL